MSGDLEKQNATAVTTSGLITWEGLPVAEVIAGVTRQQLNGERLSIIRYTYDAGTVFPAHSHPEEQVTVVLQGEIIFEINGNTVAARQGNTLFIPGGVVHRAWVPEAGPVDTVNILAPPRIQELRLVVDEL